VGGGPVVDGLDLAGKDGDGRPKVELYCGTWGLMVVVMLGNTGVRIVADTGDIVVVLTGVLREVDAPVVVVGVGQRPLAAYSEAQQRIIKKK